jgi:hypothetical protein
MLLPLTKSKTYNRGSWFDAPGLRVLQGIGKAGWVAKMQPSARNEEHKATNKGSHAGGRTHSPHHSARVKRRREIAGRDRDYNRRKFS